MTHRHFVWTLKIPCRRLRSHRTFQRHRKATVPMIGEDLSPTDDNSDEEVGAVDQTSNGKALSAGDVLHIYAAEEEFREEVEETSGIHVNRDVIA